MNIYPSCGRDIFQLQEESTPSFTTTLDCVNTITYKFKTLDEACSLADKLANLCPDPKRARVGLVELLFNAIEHGNLEISCVSKAELVKKSALKDELDRRLMLPEYRDRMATVMMMDTDDEIHFLIQDQGRGFDWHHYIDVDPNRKHHPNGRGIAWAKYMAFDRVEYRGVGNEVLAVIKKPSLS